MDFNEDFLHYAWQFRSFNQIDLKLNSGESLEIIQVGIHNTNAGPDFSEAKIKIGETLWVGQVEIHKQSSEWFKHHHEKDPAYQNVILHVVYEHDQEVNLEDGTSIPVLVLKDLIPNVLIENYKNLVLNLNSFPCANHIHSIKPLIIHSFLSRVLIERLEEKSKLVLEELHLNKGSWEEVFYQFLCKNFGFKVNSIPFNLLSKNVPYQLIQKHKSNKFQIEALLFGAAGFLDGKHSEDYPKQMFKEFSFLKKKYNLLVLPKGSWKFLRMRPQNFPTLRLAQLCGLMIKSEHLFSKITAANTSNNLRSMFEDLPINPFWKIHYHFKKLDFEISNQIGKSTVDNVLINTVSVFLYAYGKYIRDDAYIDKALILLEQIAPEKNTVISSYANSGIIANNAFDTQGILQLKKRYCDKKKCLNCGIGVHILKGV